ncbi:biotin/lipoyl-binding protein [Sphingobacterium sp. KU25419]|nr:biotin/lipoyl-binding protein [Sphingobacterium sp. KU25419]
MKIKYIVITLLVLVFGYLIWQRIAANKEKTAAPAPAGKGKTAAMAVYGTVIFAESFADNLNLTGTIEPDEQVEIRSEVSGLIDQLNFSEGSRVNKGAVLVKIVAADLLAQLEQAKTRTQLTSENERRAKLLLQKEAISQEEYDIASADYRTAKSQISLLKLNCLKPIFVLLFLVLSVFDRYLKEHISHQHLRLQNWLNLIVLNFLLLFQRSM